MLKIKDNADLKELENITLNDFINYVKKVRNDEIKSIVTHEQFSAMEYKIESEVK